MKSHSPARVRSTGFGAHPAVSRTRSRTRALPPTRTRRSRPAHDATASRPRAFSFSLRRRFECGASRTRFVRTSFAQSGSSKLEPLTFTHTRRASRPVFATLTLKPRSRIAAWESVSERGLTLAWAGAPSARINPIVSAARDAERIARSPTCTRGTLLGSVRGGRS